MLGTELCVSAPPDVSLTALDMGDVGITHREALASVLDHVRLEWVINVPRLPLTVPRPIGRRRMR